MGKTSQSKSSKKVLEVVGNYVDNLVVAGEINNRAELVEKLRTQGIIVARETKNYISVKNPQGGQNVKLKGTVYQKDFRGQKEAIAEAETKGKIFESTSAQRLIDDTKEFDSRYITKVKENQFKYRNKKPAAQDTELENAPKMVSSYVSEMNADKEAGKAIKLSDRPVSRHSVRDNMEWAIDPERPKPIVRKIGKIKRDQQNLKIFSGVHNEQKNKASNISRLRRNIGRLSGTIRGISKKLRGRFLRAFKENRSFERELVWRRRYHHELGKRQHVESSRGLQVGIQERNRGRGQQEKVKNSTLKMPEMH